MLTIAAVREQYTITDRGTIANPGKFEGEPWFVVALWDAILDGDAGEEDGDMGHWVEVTDETAEVFGMDRAVYPIGSWLYVHEDGQGFVRAVKHAHKIETVTGVGYADWASYLINGDASGIDDDDVKAADKFAEWLGGNITDVSEDTFFDRPDTGGLSGDCATYTATVTVGK